MSLAMTAAPSSPLDVAISRAVVAPPHLQSANLELACDALGCCASLCSSRIASFARWNQHPVMDRDQPAKTWLSCQSAPQRAEVDSCLLVLGKAQQTLGLAFR